VAESPAHHRLKVFVRGELKEGSEVTESENGTEPTERVLGSIDPEAAELMRGYLALPIVSAELLSDQVAQYYKQIEGFANAGEVVDVELAADLTRWCARLLDEIDDAMPESTIRLIQAAVRYFVNFEDADGDLESLIGLDDDAEILEAVAVTTGLSHILDPQD
jgi:hypothetical protein